MTDPILAKAFSVADETEQAGLIDSMARELYVVCRGRFGYETQVCGISRKLTKDGVAFIKDLHAFIELREKEI